MANIIDRRFTYNKDKNLSNRKKFIDRVKDQLRDGVKNNVNQKDLKDLASGEKMKVKVRNTEEPMFSNDEKSGNGHTVVPGNRHFNTGDEIPNPNNSNSKGKGNKASDSGDSEDSFYFSLTKEEYFDILFEDLELPDMIKKSMKNTNQYDIERQGFQRHGNPSSMDILRSTKNSMARRLALKRPKKSELKKLEEMLESELDDSKKLSIQEDIKKIKKRMNTIPYYEEMDIRFRRFEKISKPVSHAVMFCLMDVSASMDENKKDIAKRFYLLLYMFLLKQYKEVEIVFVRHTHQAEEVDENTFFYDTASGGTSVISGLNLIDSIIKERFDANKTNIYVAQLSDGDNFDSKESVKESIEKVLKQVQYFAYIEVTDNNYYNSNMFGSYAGEYTSTLWDSYSEISKESSNLQVKKVSNNKEIFGVFKELFSKKESQ